MSYPPNPPEGQYPPAGQPGQGEPAYPPAAPYPSPPQQPYPSQPYAPQSGPPAEQQPSPPYEFGQPTAVVPNIGGYPQQTSPAAPPPPSPYQPEAPVPQYPGQPGAYGESYQPGGLPASGPPTMSGPPAMDPMSGPPGYGPPYSAVPDYGQPKPKRRMATPILASLLVLFFLVSAVMTGLYIAKSGAYTKKTTSLNTTISSRDSQISDLHKQIQSLKDQLDAAGQKQSGTQSQLDETIKEKQVIGNCLTLLLEALDAASKGDQATATAKANAANQPCTESQKYLQ